MPYLRCTKVTSGAWLVKFNQAILSEIEGFFTAPDNEMEKVHKVIIRRLKTLRVTGASLPVLRIHLTKVFTVYSDNFVKEFILLPIMKVRFSLSRM